MQRWRLVLATISFTLAATLALEAVATWAWWRWIYRPQLVAMAQENRQREAKLDRSIQIAEAERLKPPPYRGAEISSIAPGINLGPLRSPAHRVYLYLRKNQYARAATEAEWRLRRPWLLLRPKSV